MKQTNFLYSNVEDKAYGTTGSRPYAFSTGGHNIFKTFIRKLLLI